MDSQPRDERYAPPQTHVEDIPAASEGIRLATRWQRVWAVSVDTALVIGLLAAVTWLTPYNLFGESDASLWTPELLSSAASFVLFIAANGWLLVRHGQTLGKRLLGIRIVRPDGTMASAARLVGLRYGIGSLVNTVPAIGMIWALFDSVAIFRRSRRCLHDSIADTIVIVA
jgi:uncharacterized RDD family membrane protein YckC